MGLIDRLTNKGYEIGRKKARDNLASAIRDAARELNSGWNRRMLFGGDTAEEQEQIKDRYFGDLLKAVTKQLAPFAILVYQNEGPEAVREVANGIAMTVDPDSVMTTWKGEPPDVYMREILRRLPESSQKWSAAYEKGRQRRT